YFGAQGDRVGLQREDMAVRADDLVFVDGAGTEAGDENFPDSGAVPQPHRMPAAVPGIEVADDRDPLRIGRPDRKAHARRSAERHGLRAETFAEPAMPAFADEMEIDVPQQRPEGIGILGFFERAWPFDPE